MSRFITSLIDRFPVADGTMAFAFERPAGFDFVAGQYLTLTLPDPPYEDEKGNGRTFSIASPPEDASRLLIATRMTGSALKRSLAEVPIGAPVVVFGPAGDFTLGPDPAIPTVFIAGGIGITPFRSMLLDAEARRLPHRITLIYSNRTPEGAAFHAEFVRLAERQASFRYVPTMTQADQSAQPWTGERRQVDVAFLRAYVGEFATPAIYLAGPPGLVAAVTQTVLDAGAAPSHVRVEEFAGYGAKPPAAAAPEPAPATVQAAAGFVPAAKVGALAPGQVMAVEVVGKRLALCNVDGAYYAIADECPHRGASLSEGDLEGTRLACPLHGALFDVTTGDVLEGPAGEGVAHYNVRISGSDIEIEA